MVNVTAGAAQKIQELIAEHGVSMGLRLFVKPGGCSGFSYGMALDERKDNDRVFEQHGIQVMVEEDSMHLIDGAEVDFEDSLAGTGFTIHNPNAVSTCGCGSSFRTKAESGQPGSCA